MGSPLGPLMANAFLCSIEEKLELDNKLPDFYRRCVDDTLATMKDVPAAEAFFHLKMREPKPPLVNNAWCTIINVICAMQSMSAILAGIYTNVLTNTVFQQSASISRTTTALKPSATLTVTFPSSKSVTEN